MTLRHADQPDDAGSGAIPEPEAHDCASHDHATPAAAPPKRSVVRWIVLAPILFYKRLISPLLGPHCRYEPTCSSYAVQAVDQFGILRGLVLASWRIARCQPFGGHGLDRVEDQTIFPLSARLKRAPK